MDGFRQEENIDNEDEMKCVDINECVENKNLCPVGAYCLNNEGSYSCEGKETVPSRDCFKDLNSFSLCVSRIYI